MRTPKGKPELVPTHAHPVKLVVHQGQLKAVKLMLDGVRALRLTRGVKRGPGEPAAFEGVAQTGTWLGAPVFVDVRAEVAARVRAHQRAKTNGHGGA